MDYKLRFRAVLDLNCKVEPNNLKPTQVQKWKNVTFYRKSSTLLWEFFFQVNTEVSH